ncbi:MAG: FtsW/RodA/SpoVE family cell cycle protein [Coriobacteriales bacterium]|jgi:cell division protein FtsW|nr:FtsW/RodA/SpoVE family cell cycle protein [Coriobacteriales bacterium]
MSTMRKNNSLTLALPSASLMLVLVSILLFAYGLAMGFSASFVQGYTGTEQLFQQLFFTIIGALGVVILLLVGHWLFAQNRRLWFYLVTVIWIASLITMALVFVPGFGIQINGATRWLDLPLLPRFQPSELAKVALILYAAATIERLKEGASVLHGYALAGSYVLLLGLTILQKDIGSVMLLHMGLLAVLFFGEMPLLAKGVKAFTSIIPLVVIPLIGLAATYFLPSYRQARWAGFWCPLEYDSIYKVLGDADQLRNGFFALGGGGLSGLGPGLSKQKYFYLSFPDTDFIFAIIGEELGLIGATAVILLFILFAWFGLLIARHAASAQGKMLAGGATALIVCQALVNIGGVVGALPLTGKPLPFFSMGGSSLVITCLLIGCILLVAWYDKPQDSATRRRDAFRLVEGYANNYQMPSNGLRGSSVSSAISASNALGSSARNSSASDYVLGSSALSDSNQRSVSGSAQRSAQSNSARSSGAGNAFVGSSFTSAFNYDSHSSSHPYSLVAAQRSTQRNSQRGAQRNTQRDIQRDAHHDASHGSSQRNAQRSALSSASWASLLKAVERR